MDNARGDVSIYLDGQERVMRPSFEAIWGIERDLNTNIMPLLHRISNGDVGVYQCAVIIFHGLRGNEDTRLTLAQVGEAVVKGGLTVVGVPVISFVMKALKGVDMGKLDGQA